jgi:UMF1 family MFS transporter
MPETKDTASFFSFYDVTEKLAIVIGTFSFGLVESIAGSMRNSVLALMAYFLIAFVLMLFTIRQFNKEQKAIA